LPAPAEPGGILWIDTPNLDSHSHRLYGRNFSSLDAPRHLTLFTFFSLRRLLAENGLVDITDNPIARSVRRFFNKATPLPKVLIHSPKLPTSPLLHIRAWISDTVAWFRPERREFITFIAMKPSSDRAPPVQV